MRLQTIIFGMVFLFATPALSAQENSETSSEAGAFPVCEKTDPANETNDVLYKGCFTPPAGRFYGRALVDFSIQNADLNSLLEDADSNTRRNFLRVLGNLFVENTDTAHFVLLATATNGDSGSVSLGALKLFSIRKVGHREYALTSDRRFGPLPVRFIADPATQIQFSLGVVAERQTNSRIAELLEKISRFAGVNLPSFLTANLTSSQEEFIDLDRELSNLLQTQQVISNFVPLYFDPSFAQSYESEFALSRYLPEGVGLRLRIATSAEETIFPQVLRQSETPGDGDSAILAEPGGLRADQFKNTPYLGQQLTNHVLGSLQLRDYTALRQATNEQDFLNACWRLVTYLDTGPLELTAADKLRVSWAHVSGNPLLTNSETRSKYCLASKENDLRALGLGLPELDRDPLPDANFVVLDRSRREAESARVIVGHAVSKRDEAMSALEAAIQEAQRNPQPTSQRPSAEDAAGRYLIQPYGFWVFSGLYLAEGETVVGEARDRVENRLGNRYFGEVVRIGDRVILQGLGQYQSESEADGLGYKTLSGRFEADLITGNAEIRFHSGDRYLGQVSRERAHGFGIWTETDGTRYYSESIDGERTGLAVKEDSSGIRTAGSFITHDIFRPLDE